MLKLGAANHVWGDELEQLSCSLCLGVWPCGFPVRSQWLSSMEDLGAFPGLHFHIDSCVKRRKMHIMRFYVSCPNETKSSISTNSELTSNAGDPLLGPSRLVQLHCFENCILLPPYVLEGIINFKAQTVGHQLPSSSSKATNCVLCLIRDTWTQLLAMWAKTAAMSASHGWSISATMAFTCDHSSRCIFVALGT